MPFITVASQILRKRSLTLVKQYKGYKMGRTPTQLVTEQEFYMDGYLRQNLEYIKEAINKHDMDMVGLVDGYEGVGKSVLAMQIGYFVDPSLTLDRITFNAEQFKEQILKAGKGQCVIFDEAITGLFNREAVQQMNILLIKMMAQIRQKNLLVLIVLPSFFDLDKNIALWRSKFLVHSYFGKGFKRGQFRFYGHKKKIELYTDDYCKKRYFYPSRENAYDFHGSFTNHYVTSEKKYRAKKETGLTESDYEKVSLKRTRLQRDSYILFLSNMGMTQEDIAELSDLLDEGTTQMQISRILVKHNNASNVKQIPTILKSKYEEKFVSQVSPPIEKIEELPEITIDDTKFRKKISNITK